ncbi:acetate/propionate family kinase [Rhodospirillaceae bacterium SYSU D60014]|uniref:acetate/propionate family kinase n=1 Tax=Virgifigura deserti TaxID=2268457 RepID=UPI000E66F276
MTDRLLVLNAGSSSLKFALYEPSPGNADPALTLRGQIAGIGVSPRLQAADSSGRPLPFETAEGTVRNHCDALALLLDWLGRDRGGGLAGVGHRVVHGGALFSAPIRITPEVVEQLAALEPLAPHHQPHNVAAIRALVERLPDLPQVACFDTAFHATQPAEAKHLGLPRGYADRGLRRYGFHGLSYESVVSGLPHVTRAPLPRRLVIAHLGNGASMCAVEDGRSVATTMGFSTLDGLVMGTRSGSLDPGALLHLMRTEGMSLAEVEDLLYNRSGLLGLSGLSSDMKSLLASDDPSARAAVAQYCYQIHRHLGSLAAALNGLDALVFTGGIGENAAPVRAAVCRDADWLGIILDEAANQAGSPLITAPESRVPVWVIATDEEMTIARHCRAALKG